jgi:hypothetical protein
MKQVVGLCVLIGMLLCSVAGWAADKPTSDPAKSAPWLGDKKFTIHFAGTARDAVDELNKITGLAISPARSAARPGGPGQPGTSARMDIPVTLDFTDATLDKILLALCEQAKLVYDPLPGGSINLQEGDVKLDGRPMGEAGEYTVRVTNVSVSSNRSYALRWGAPAPDDPDENNQFNVQVRVSAKSEEAQLRLAGIDANPTATTDKGTAVENQFPNAPIWAQRMVRPGGFDIGSFPMNISLRYPTDGAATISKLEGNLRLYSSAKIVELQIPAGSVGKSFAQDGMTVKVDSWDKAGKGETVTLTTTGGQAGPGWTGGGVQVMTMTMAGGAPGAPAAGGRAGVAGAAGGAPPIVINAPGAAPGQAPPAGPRGAVVVGAGGGGLMNVQGPAGMWGNGFVGGKGFGMGNSQSVTIVTKDGQEQQTGMSSMSTTGDGTTRCTYQIAGGLDVDYLRFVSVVRGPADKTVPFVIENIPLP